MTISEVIQFLDEQISENEKFCDNLELVIHNELWRKVERLQNRLYGYQGFQEKYEIATKQIAHALQNIPKEYENYCRTVKTGEPLCLEDYTPKCISHYNQLKEKFDKDLLFLQNARETALKTLNKFREIIGKTTLISLGSSPIGDYNIV